MNWVSIATRALTWYLPLQPPQSCFTFGYNDGQETKAMLPLQSTDLNKALVSVSIVSSAYQNWLNCCKIVQYLYFIQDEAPFLCCYLASYPKGLVKYIKYFEIYRALPNIVSHQILFFFSILYLLLAHSKLNKMSHYIL